MSLGWQTESALLPSKAKPIAVGDRSILSLKALLYQKEQQRSLKSSNTDIDTQPSKHRNKEKDNNALQIGKKRKEISKPRDEEEEREEKARQALEAKARLYEEIEAGKASGAAALVDFKTKHKQNKYESSSLSPPSTVNSVSNEVSKPKIVHHEYGANQWQWSNSNSNSSISNTNVISNDNNLNLNPDDVISQWRTEQREERALQNEIETRISSHTNIANSNGSNNTNTSGSSYRVQQSQWEKVLNNSAKPYLEAVHQEVEKIRNSSTGTSSDNNSNKNININNSSREERLEILKRRRMELTQSKT
jgi:hypothetical protein